IKSFLCPSDPISNQGPQVDLSFEDLSYSLPFDSNLYGIYGAPLARKVGVTNYYAITGQNWGGPGLCCYAPSVDPRFVWPAAGTTIPVGGTCTICDGAINGDGIFFIQYKTDWQAGSTTIDNRPATKIPDITDGTSNTFMLGESLVRPGYPVAWAH